MDLKEIKIIETAETFREDIIDLTFRLVKQASTLGEEAPILRIMEEELIKLDLEPIRVDMRPEILSKHPGWNRLPDWAPTPISYENRYNLVAIRPADGEGGQSALFNGHLDIVSAEPLTSWSHDPFQPVLENDWIYGRGSGDMKSGVALMCYAQKAIEKAGFGLRAPVTIEVVIEEECTGNGTLACINTGYDADAVLIPEPFGSTICTNQVGVFWFKVTIDGIAGHASTSTSGVNAIEKSYPIIRALRQLEAKTNQDFHPAYKGMERPVNLNIGMIKGGNWPSSVPAMAEIHGRFGHFPGKTSGEAQQSLIEAVKKAASEDDWLSENQPKVEFYGLRHNGFSIERNLPAFRILNGCHKAITGDEVIERISTAGSDLCVYHSFTDAQATTFGPVAENIHGPNERVNIKSILHTAKVYALFLARWCELVE
jgi:acetylornithine deacetylase